MRDSPATRLENTRRPVNAASVMFFRIWPGVKHAAAKVIELCAKKERLSYIGSADLQVELEEGTNTYSHCQLDMAAP